MNNNLQWNYPEYYQIEGTGNIDRYDYVYFNDPSMYPEFQNEFIEYKNMLIDLADQKIDPISILRYGDGDYYFLTKQAIGSASPGKRALSVDYSNLSTHDQFIDGVCKNDYIATEISPRARQFFNTLYPNRKIDFPLEFIYGTVANRWIFKNFNNLKVGIIGASEKLYLIEKLLEYPEYQDYIGISDFELIHFPQKFACDDINLVENFVGEQLKAGTADVYFVGISSAKLALLHRFKKYRHASYIDIGCGIDALAGCLTTSRPYFFNWTNYRLSDHDYSDIDYMKYKHENEKFLK